MSDPTHANPDQAAPTPVGPLPLKFPQVPNETVGAAQSISAVVGQVGKVVETPEGAALVAEAKPKVPRGVRKVIHTTIGVLGALVAIGSAVGSVLTGNDALLVSTVIGILAGLESILSLTHLGDQ